MIKVLGIAASPRRGGNSDILLDEVLKGAAEAALADVEKLIVSSLNISRALNVIHAALQGSVL